MSLYVTGRSHPFSLNMTSFINADVAEIRDLNLSYLLIAQRMFRENFARGLYRTGLCQEAGQTLCKLSVSQTIALASTNVLICGFRLNDADLLATLSKEGIGNPLAQTRLTMAMAQAPVMQPDNSVV